MFPNIQIINLEDDTCFMLDANGQVVAILSERNLLEDKTILERIRLAIDQHIESRKEDDHRSKYQALFQTLSDREKQVLKLLIEAKHTKQIADELSVSTKTIEFHRGNILRKMEVESVVQLIRFVLTLQR